MVLPFMPNISKWSVLFRLSGHHFVLCSSGNLRFGWYLRTVCSVVWYSPDDIMWYGNYCIKTSLTLQWLFQLWNVLAADVFGMGIIHWHLVPLNRYQPHTLLLHFVSSFLTSSHRNFQFSRIDQETFYMPCLSHLSSLDNHKSLFKSSNYEATRHFLPNRFKYYFHP